MAVSLHIASYNQAMARRLEVHTRIILASQLAVLFLAPVTATPTASAASHASALSQLAVEEADMLVSNDTYRLRLCNAYTFHEPLEMRRTEEPKLVEYPLAYKECRDYSLPLRDGDNLEFHAGNRRLGRFTVRGLAAPGSLLLLIPKRVNKSSYAMAFQSHSFTASESSQLCIVDATTDADSASTLRISGVESSKSLFRGSADEAKSDKDETFQELNFNAVVSLRPGSYKLGLANAIRADSGEGSPWQRQLVTLGPGDCFVAMRVGAPKAESAYSRKFPEELVVFPSSGALRVGVPLTLVFLALWQLLFLDHREH